MRECDGCTACCEGWWHANIRDHEMYRGRPCFFKKGGGCSIYEDRPDDPCRRFNCAWKTDESIPFWMKPNESKVGLQWMDKDGHRWLRVEEHGKTLDVKVLNWLLHYHIETRSNIQYTIDGGWNWLGDEAFCKYMSE